MMGYQIKGTESNKILIRHDLRDELDGFITLMKSIASELDGRILQMDGDIVRYTISQDPFDLVYEWDSNQGITVIVKSESDIEAVIDMLKTHFEKLNS